jgi:hypothetical protein
MDADERLRAGRLAAQRLTPATACRSAEEAALAVIGVQAQDLRAAALALRSRVPGLTRSAVRAAPLLRTWTVRGTVHLIAASDRVERALSRARDRARRSGVEVSWVAGDVTRLSTLGLDERFDLLFDRGCFHDLSDAAREGYVSGVSERAAPDATLLLLARACLRREPIQLRVARASSPGWELARVIAVP